MSVTTPTRELLNRLENGDASYDDTPPPMPQDRATSLDDLERSLIETKKRRSELAAALADCDAVIAELLQQLRKRIEDLG